ncbi:hypothetical protein Stsp02_14510 [Streptomyces sp. NBRC 14336]|uniref:excalibur calcium-binding domain-containing protein n=1 Tax=Streptomyces sp. NBRC 14336 TaxID=3030992 RepID=UPI0024A038A7|nr:LAETG motif-containing sortase-dependent surface protein [Streptomyces sp. NBRC 14336]WBO77858.1 excalibur calcium-binding domain-containing protein [Streptomyces sp. SBE_14.2]GLW45789.1 hypothetical protein Stsp02_14510 [Streptomyces sp. NBRC 14336]
MRHVRTSTALAVAALALTLSSGAAVAHDGDHPFANCPEAYENGYANITADDEHYGGHLDRDNDGIGCDQPPADFEPAADAAEDDSTDLAATGGNSTTPYLAGGGAAVLLAGGGVLLAVRRRRGAPQ